MLCACVCNADTADLQELLYQEMRGRIKEEDVSVPLRKGPFFYYTKTLEGKQYKLHCRRAIPGGEGPGTVDEVVDDADSDAPPEEVLLDENENALPHEFYSLGSLQVICKHNPPPCLVIPTLPLVSSHCCWPGSKLAL